MHYTVYTEYYILYTIHYTLYTIYYILYTIYYVLYTIYYILYTIYYILYTIYYILYTTYYIPYTIYYILYTIYYPPTPPIGRGQRRVRTKKKSVGGGLSWCFYPLGPLVKHPSSTPQAHSKHCLLYTSPSPRDRG